MQKVISINLNGNAYQLDESGYDTLREYLARADRALSDNPDRAEIMADLEQAIADKCQRYLGPHKTVVTASEIDVIVAQMGPVDNATGEGAAGTGASTSDGAEAAESAKAPPRRLYRIMDGAMIAGVCNGLAAFLNVDVAFPRIAFVAAALLTKGAGIIAYVVMMFVVPEATTPEARAAAAGAPLNAKDVIERARKQYAEGRKEWRRQWTRQRRRWQRHPWPLVMPVAYGPPGWAALLLPVFGLAQVALFLIMAAMMISLVNTGAILNWHLPPDVPVWAAALILLVVYQMMVSPLRLAHHWTSVPRPGFEPAWFAFWNAVVWLVGLAFVVWIASNHVPELREFLKRLPDLFRDFAYAIRDLVERYRAGDQPR
jgi:phage shock protein PspC (stress-responsive transcriptional regulator)